MTLATPEVFGARVRRMRRRLGLTGGQMSVKAKISHNVLSRIELGKSEPGVFKAARIAEALGVTLDALLAPAGCETCDGLPPAGYICPDCRTRGTTP